MPGETKTHLATVSILVKERDTHVAEVNAILSRHADRIISRLGVNLDRFEAIGGSGLIDVVVLGTAAELKALTDELDALYGIVARISVLD
ncbi:MAG: hypothetical protein HGB18_00645 [Candidatus Moranbacteria bacterium]|nr:hypothetical protein [Candidatus Moranbacteria bacterium]